MSFDMSIHFKSDDGNAKKATMHESLAADLWSDLKTGATLVGDVAKGAKDEVVHHPEKVLVNAAMGAAIGTAAILVSPEIAVGVGVVGAAALGFELAHKIPQWGRDAVVVGNPEHFSPQRRSEATSGLQRLGANVVDYGAASLSGWGGASLFVARPAMIEGATNATILAIQGSHALYNGAKDIQKTICRQ
jgi:hypothetical protein